MVDSRSRPWLSAPRMAIVATIMNSTTGKPIRRFTFGRMPKPWASFILETGERVTADRVDVGKPAPGKVVVPVSVWVTPKKERARQRDLVVEGANRSCWPCPLGRRLLGEPVALPSQSPGRPSSDPSATPPAMRAA